MSQIPGEDKMMFAKEAFFSWGISLDVTPRVSTNGIISIQIVPTISSQSDWVTSGATDASDSTTISARYPVIDVQRLVTDFDMASGTTAVIGGLSRTVETQKDSGIPFLRDIWWIGPRLFGSKIRVKEQREIIVFVTVGLALALLSPFTGLSGLPLHRLATIGYAIAGFGISALVPILYSKANKTKSMPTASALTFVTSMGFLGSFMGPPLIGHIAQATCLPLALGIFAVLILVCLFLRFDND